MDAWGPGVFFAEAAGFNDAANEAEGGFGGM